MEYREKQYNNKKDIRTKKGGWVVKREWEEDLIGVKEIQDSL